MTSILDCEMKSLAGNNREQSNTCLRKKNTVKANNKVIQHQTGKSYVTAYEEIKTTNDDLINQRIYNIQANLYDMKFKGPKESSKSSNLRTHSIQPHNDIPFNPSTRRKEKSSKNKVFGDHLVEKEDSVIRIVSQNVNCIGVSHEINHKQENAKDWMIQHSVDIVGWQETGVAFHTLPRHKLLEIENNSGVLIISTRRALLDVRI